MRCLRKPSRNAFHRDGIAGGKGLFHCFIEQLLLPLGQVLARLTVTRCALRGNVGIGLACATLLDRQGWQFFRIWIFIHHNVSVLSAGATVSKPLHWLI